MNDPALEAVAARALEPVTDGCAVGLGTGRAAEAFITCLGQRVRSGLRVRAVASSQQSAQRAREAGIPLADPLRDAIVELDLTVDGADEVAPNLDLVKGWGGALVRERILASISKRLVILVRHDKLVSALGERGRIPVEIVPFAHAATNNRLMSLGLETRLRTEPGGTQAFVTDNHNWIIDCRPAGSLDAQAACELERAVLAIPGVVDTGLFLGMAERVLVGHDDGTAEILLRTSSG